MLTGRFHAPYGGNLESACRAYARFESIRPVRTACRCCGFPVTVRGEHARPGTDGIVRVYCGPACQSEGAAEDEHHD